MLTYLDAIGYPTAPATLCDQRTTQQIAAWDGACKVHGISNSDAAVDTGYTIEMRFDEHNIGRITFKASTGQSGPKAFEKLSKILDLEGSAEGLTT